MRDDGASKLAAALREAGVGKRDRAEVLERIALLGIEVGKTWLRVPVAEQIAHRLADGGAVPMRTLAATVTGATKREAQAAAEALCARREAELVVRGKEVVLVAFR